MYFTAVARCKQLLPMATPPGECWTGLAFTRTQAALGRSILYVASTTKQARMMLGAEPLLAARMSQTTGATKITVAELREKPKYLDYEVVVLDVVATEYSRRSWWTKFIEEQLPRVALVYIAYNANGLKKFVRYFSTVRKDAVAAAAEVNRKSAHAIGPDDKALHYARANNRDGWDPVEFWNGLEQEDATADVAALKGDYSRMKAAYDAIRVEEVRHAPFIEELEDWAGRPLTDPEILQELDEQGLTRLRGTYDPTWIAQQQWSDLHDPDETDLRMAGSDRYADDRRNPASALKVLHNLLGPTISAAVKKGEAVTVTRADSVRASRRCSAARTTGGRRVVDLLTKSWGSIAKRMEDKSTAKESTRFIGKLLRMVGYTLVQRSQRRVRRSGVQEASARYEPIVPKPAPEGGTPQGSTSSFVEFRDVLPPAILEGAPVYIAGDSRPQNCAKAGVEWEGVPQVAGTIGGFSLDVDAWRALGAPPASSDGFDRATTYGVVPQFVKDGVLYIPDPAKRRAASDKEGRQYGWWPGTKAMVQAISKTHRSLLAALPGRTLLNFDFSAAHIRFAGKLAVDHDQRKQLQSVSEAADPYQALATPLSVTRADAKLILLKVLNGGRNVREHCPLDWDGPRYARFLKDLSALLQPWEKYCEDLNLGDPLRTKKGPTSAQQRGSFELQRAERRLCEYTLTELKKTAPQLRLLATMYDGALLDMDQADSVPAAFLAVEAAAAFAAKKLGYTKIGVTMNVGQTWKQAEES